MLDLILRGCNLPDGRSGIDIGIAGGKIAAVEPKIAGEARREIDATGRLVTPPFIDSHFHMDSTLSLGMPRLNLSCRKSPSRFSRNVRRARPSGESPSFS